MKRGISFLYIFLIVFSVSAQEAFSGLKFIVNKGQWENNVKYRADLPGGKLFAETKSFTYLFYDTEFLAQFHRHNHSSIHKEEGSEQENLVADNIKIHAFRMIPLGALSTTSIIPSKTSTEDYNYYLGNDPSRWASGAKASGELLYKGIYENTDLRLYQSDHTFKYEFVVYAGARPENIRLKYEGLSNIFIRDGNLILQTSVNTITENAPYVYQNINGKEVKINSRFKLRDSTVTFELLQSYNKDYPLIIDPQLIFSTYSGSTADNWGNTGAYDQAGNMYSGGTVFDAGFPTTVGAYQVNYGGIPSGGPPFYPDYGIGIDVGILKYNPSGTGLLYATYLGGRFTDVPYSLVVNSSDELVLVGSTSSFNFPITAGAFDNSFNGGVPSQPVGGIIFWNGADIFVSRLSSNGSTLLASTYVGGSGNDGIQVSFETLTRNYGDQLRGDVITDKLNNIYVACNTRSLNFPVSPGAYQPVNKGGKDACVFKLNSAMTAMAWSTYLGGVGEDAAYSIQVDSLYNVYVSGGTASPNFPVTAGVYQMGNLGNVDGFVSHIKNDGKQLLHSSFAGTTSYDQAYFVQLDQKQNVYLLGQTAGAYPVSAAGVYTNANSGQFIHAFTSDLASTLFSTVVGNGGFQPNISPTAFLVNDCGNIFLSGWGGALNKTTDGFVGGNTFGLPVTPDAYRGVSDGSDFYIMVLKAGASALLYATYFGMNDPGIPDHVDGGTSRFDKKGIIYEAVCGGCEGSSNFPTTPGAWSRTNNSFNCNNAAFKFDLVSLKSIFNAGRADSCGKATVTLVNQSLGGKTFAWDFGDGQTSTLQSPTNHYYTHPGTYTVMLIVTDLTTCTGKDTSKVKVFVPPIPPITFSLLDTIICTGATVQLGATANPTYSYKWTPGNTLNKDSIPNPSATPAQSTSYHVVVKDTNQCIVEKDIKVNLYPSSLVDAGPNLLICPNTTTQLNAVGNGTFVWETSPYLSCSVCRSPYLKPPAVSDDFYTVEITDLNGCKKQDSVRVQTRPFPVIAVSLKWQGRCYSENVNFTSIIHYSDTTCFVASTPVWNFGDGQISNELNPIHNYTSQGNFPVTFQYAYSNIAADTARILDKDSCLKNVYIPNTFTPNGDGDNDKVYLRTINATKILFRIFNRWGEEVFRTESLHEGWDGTYKGVKQTPQTFVYTADVTFYDKTAKTLEGNITLVE
jgi:gliding motility-associated-like protein